MIEARVPWTLEGPDDSITFDPYDPNTPWMLVEKPRTVVDDRRDVYDYPLDDGSYVGDAYAGHRLWQLSARLRASSHEERNEELQRLAALLNSIRRTDGLLKWEPTGFPAVQATVRRNGPVDYSGGNGLHLPVSFGLISGDPRVYSQTLNEETVAPGTPSYGANLLTTNQSDIETNTAGWTAGTNTTLSRVTSPTAHGGTGSMRVQKNFTLPPSATAILDPRVATTAGLTYTLGFWTRTSSSNVRVAVRVLSYDGSGVLVGEADLYPYIYTYLTVDTWTEFASDFVPPTGTVTSSVEVSFGGDGFVGSTVSVIDDISVKLKTYSSSTSVVNAGDAVSAPVVLIDGPITSPVLSETGSPSSMTLDTTIADGETATVDAGARSIYSGAVLSSASNLYSVKSATESFPVVVTGASDFSLSGSSTSGATLLTVRWRDAWMP